MLCKFWLPVASATVFAVSAFAPAANAMVSKRSVCYAYAEASCKGSYDLKMTLVGSATAPTDLIRAAAPVCNVDSTHAKLIKKLEEGGKDGDHSVYYHFFRFECEK